MTVTGKMPVGVELVVLMVSPGEQVALHVPGLNPAVAPLGSPEAENETVWVEPAVRVAVIVLEPDAPGVTVMPPEFDRE